MGREIKLARIKKGFSQGELRKILKEKHLISISPRTLIEFEHGNYKALKYYTMIAMAKELDTTVEELFLSDTCRNSKAINKK